MVRKHPDTWKMAKMNLAIRGIDADLGQYNADTFTNDLHKRLKADFILANPPFNYHPWGHDELVEDQRWAYGTPPANNANYAWIQHMIYHLANHGKIGLVLANGALSSQTGGEGKIRQKIIEDDLIKGIIALPTQLFYSVTIPVTLWFITKGKKQTGKTLFIDARDMGHMVDRKHRDFTDEDIQKLADTFTAFQEGKLKDEKGFCAVMTTEDIAKQDYILTPGRYVGIPEQEDDGEPFEEKMTRLTSELSEMFKKSHELEDEIRKKLGRSDMKFKHYFMEDALEDIIDYRGKTPHKATSGIQTLSAKSVKDGYIDYSNCYFISLEEYYRFMVRGIPKTGDVLLTTEAPLGNVARLDKENIALAQRVLALRGKQGVLDTGFLYYYLRSPIGQAKLREKETGTTVTGIKQSEFRRIEIDIPSYAVQKKIVDILCHLDQKIELNRKINKNLYAA